MHGMALRGCVMVLGLATSMAGLAQVAGAPRVAPAGICLDARTITKIHQSGPRQIDIVTADSHFHRLITQDDCPGVDAVPGARVLAAEGWVCNGRRAFIRHDKVVCPVVEVQQIDGRTFAVGERARLDGATTLDPVIVRGERLPGFNRSPYSCFSPRYMQSWSDDPEGITVQVSRRHPGGFRRYRVNTMSCSGLGDHQGEIGFRSGLGIGVICGHPGDVVMPVIRPETPLEDTSHLHLAPRAAGCSVYEVYPLE